MNKRAEERRKQVLRATLKAISEKGFSVVTLQDIADYADVSKGVISYYFENKEDVFYHLLEWMTDRIFQNEYAAIQKESKAIDKMRAYVNAAFKSPEDNRIFYSVYLEFLAQVNQNERFREVNSNFYKNCWFIGSEIIQKGKSEGIFTNIEVESGSHMIRALIDGCLLQWLMRDDEMLHSYYRDNCYDAIITYLNYKDS
ncbi:TetR/AcrR family transcriptional regulator [Psychrobacillus soli]|uniref:TetR/AcrR family transcriptional regulator n=1 Tax=Psychrobacillus soli TaxID=1543965 RepID=A0A544TDW3_9BACI|nr:TetR/AcrR family transcriptional regulator [Psychrobacillus soli]TQR15586.1 TetR/AcrR family transcriptional regulator [Psychrobacillus soli]